jgi:Ca-activated chloride channel family protein
VKTESPDAIMFEHQDQRFEEPRPAEAMETPTLTEPEPAKAPARDVLPEIPVRELLTTPQLAQESQPVLPDASRQLPGGRVKVQFFAEAIGKSFVWVIDRSASMDHKGAIEVAKKELLRGLETLNAENKFQIVFYNSKTLTLSDDGQLLTATKKNLDRAKRFVESIHADGGTDHNAALLAALRFRPEVVFFLTDADLMSLADVRMLTGANRQVRRPATIHTIEFGSGANLADDKPLRKLAEENDGTFNFVNVTTFSAAQ